MAPASPGYPGVGGTGRSCRHRCIAGKPPPSLDSQPAVPAAAAAGGAAPARGPGFPAAEVARILGITTAAVKSAPQRARARIEETAPAAGRLTEPPEPQVRALLEQYIAAFENSDAATLEGLLRKDAMLEMTPSPTWFTGDNAITCAVSGLGSPGDWKMIATAANGQPAAAAYRRGRDGAHHAYAIVVLTATTTGIGRIVVFGDPGLFRRFGLPPVHPASP
ncbi:MAG: hypothetical protein ACRDPD_14380 [Streptosporangiaceae bacterium]